MANQRKVDSMIGTALFHNSPDPGEEREEQDEEYAAYSYDRCWWKLEYGQRDYFDPICLISGTGQITQFL